MGWGKIEKPEEERSLLLKCLPPVGNISKQSSTKTPRTCSLQNVPKGDFFQSRLAASELLPHLQQQSRCQNGLSLLCHQPGRKAVLFMQSTSMIAFTHTVNICPCFLKKPLNTLLPS